MMEQIVLIAGIILCLFGAYVWAGAIKAERRWQRTREKVLKELEDVVAFNDEAIKRFDAAVALAHSLETDNV